MSMRTLIVGGGIAGLSLASFLKQRGLEPVIVEQAEKWSRIGYGISLWGNGIKILQTLDLGEKFLSEGAQIEEWTLRNQQGEVLSNIQLEYGQSPPLTTIHRGDLHALIRETVPQDWIRMGTTVTDIRQSPETVAVTLSDGSEMQYDLVVGADGVHSCVRELVLSDYKVEDAGTAVWSFWIPADIGVPHGFTEMWGKGGKAFLLAPVNGQMMGSVALPYAGPLDTANHLQVLKSQIREGEWILPRIEDTLNRPQDVFRDKNYQVQAKRWANGRIVLIGDAAHAIHPIAGMGASLALEDAYVLTQEITGRAPRDVEAAASAFVDRRRSRVRKFQWMASISKRVVFTRSSVLAWMRDSAVRCASLLEGFFVDQARKSAEDLFEKL